MYDEAADFATHLAEIETMDRLLARASCEISWEEAVICDVGGGGGLRAALLSQRAKRVYSSDIIDQQTRYRGEFLKLLAEKMDRHGHAMAMDRMEIHVSDAMDMIYRDGMFDFVFSVNAFEHIPRPERALREIARVLKSGAIAYLSFDPIWTADSGSHFSHRVPEPWAHLVFSDQEFCARMKAAGADEGEIREYQSAMNRLPLEHYVAMFSETKALGLATLFRDSWSGVTKPENKDHPFFRAALQRHGEQALLTRGMAAILQKR